MDQAERLRRLMNSKPGATRAFRVITVSSGKGGVGKTNFVINLALALQKKGFKVAILDADFGMANVDILFGVRSDYSIYDILYKDKKLEDIIVEVNEGIKIIPGGSGIKELCEINEAKRNRLLTELSKIQNIDFLLVDTSAGLSKVVLNFIGVADDVIVITNPEPTALTDAYGLIKVVVKSNASSNINIIINRAKNIVEAKDTFEKIFKTIEIFLNKKVKYLGFIKEDLKVGQAVREQKPFYEIYPNSEASLCINKISSELLGVEVKTENHSIKEYFNKLIRIMGR